MSDSNQTQYQALSCRRVEYVNLTWVEPAKGYTLEQIRTLLNRGVAELHRGEENSIKLQDGTEIATFKEFEATADSVEYDDFQVGA